MTGEANADQILRILVEKKLIAIEAANAALEKINQGESARAVLVDSGLVEDGQFAQALAAVLNLPFVDLAGAVIPKEVLNVIPESTARGHLIVAYQQTEEGLKVAMADPNDRQIVEFIRKKVDRPVEVALASISGIKEIIGQYQETLVNELQNIVTEAQAVVSSDDNLDKAAEDLPIIKITEAILKHAILQNASDIHVEPMEKQIVIRYRIDGLLKDALVLPKNVLPGLVARIKVLSSLKIDEHRLPQDGRFKVETDDYRIAFRVSILPVFDGEKIVMRLLDESGHGLTMSEIGLGERALKIFRKAISNPHGMVLVTGPTGSGKTTTLYAAMQELNQPEVNISTIEDPIEYRMERINQTQVQPKIGLTFANGLRALVRQDPDIIMVGEIRDEETASLAINAALTGHLVLSTLHTNSAAGAIPRLIDMGVEPFLIASTANILLAQRLVRKLCEDCRQEAKLDKAILDSINMVINTDELLEVMQREGVIKKNTAWDAIKIYMPAGCRRCHEGYRGRVGIYEMIEVTPEIQRLITSNITSADVEKAAREQQQMVSMVEDGLIKVVQGVTSVEEVLRVAKE